MRNIISILGIQTELVPIQRNELKGLNADLLLRFDYYTAVFNHQELCLIRAKHKEALTPLKYRKITERISAVTGIPVVVMIEALAYYERERLISQGVYFVVSHKYAFLPSLVASVRAKVKDRLPVKLTPVAQYMLLCYLQDEQAKDNCTIKELEKIVPYNYVAIARAVTNLESCDLCCSETDHTGTKQIRFSGTKRELWNNSQKYLSSPVKKVLYSDVKPEGKFSISGVNALSHYSHLNPEQYETLAIRDKYFDVEKCRYNEIEGMYKIEIWKYPTSIPYRENVGLVDKLSLFLSMRNDPDSRIEKELEIMIEEMKW